MPVLKFDQETNFNDLCRKKVKNPVFKGNALIQAFQKVKFNLNESGAVLESEAEMNDFFGESPKPRKFVFNSQFLLCLWKTGAKYPYLAVWVNNPDILLKYENKKTPAN